MSEAAVTRRVTFGDVLANREFRAMYVAQALSIAGDQLARVAVALLIFARSGSPLLTALAYGVTFLPWLIGGPWLSVYADRLPRRQVMVACDLARAIIVLLIAIPHIPLALALLVVCVVSLLEPPFSASRGALLADIAPTSNHYATASALGATVNQLGQVIGFGVGGAVVAAISPRGAIAIDSVTFVASAVLLLRYVTARPTIKDPDKPASALTRQEALAFITRDRRVRSVVLLAYAVVAATIAPECIAVPYAAAHGGGAIAAGILTAAVPLGTMLGAVFVGRVLGQNRAERWITPLALGTAVSLALTGTNPPMPLAVLIWVVGGACSAMIITSSTLVARLTPANMRGRVFGIIGSGLAAVQGLSALLVGWIAEYTTPAIAIADIALPMLALAVILIARMVGDSRNSAFEPISTEGADQGLSLDESVDESKDEDEMPATANARRSHAAVWGLTVVLAAITVGFRPSFTASPSWTSDFHPGGCSSFSSSRFLFRCSSFSVDNHGPFTWRPYLSSSACSSWRLPHCSLCELQQRSFRC
jgi:MFS family permease